MGDQVSGEHLSGLQTWSGCPCVWENQAGELGGAKALDEAGPSATLRIEVALTEGAREEVQLLVV